MMLTPLTQDHAFFRREPAPLFWAMLPHLISQHTDSACALASAAMAINTLRSLDGHHRIGDVVSEQRLLDAMNDEHWRQAFQPRIGNGLTLARYAEDFPKALALFGLADHWQVSLHRVAVGDVVATDYLRHHLARAQHSANLLLIANFHLATFYGDGVDVGHYSPIAAYDQTQDRVLVLDVYKPDYEPVWAPLTRMVAAMAVRDVNEGARGYLLLERKVTAVA
jgi:hypothetical protein